MIRVFAMPGSRAGGNPAPVWLDADPLSCADMQKLAHSSGHESVFVLEPSDGSSQFRMRYFVPEHEMEMCGHATIAALWLLHRLSRWDGAPTTVETASGKVSGRFVDGMVEISQPQATVAPVDDELVRDIAQCLRVDPAEIISPVLNSATSRVKTLVRLVSPATLHGLEPDSVNVEALCARLGSTGLYPFALAGSEPTGSSVSARQFPKSSGYPEDPATGIAAAALAWGLRALGLTTDERILLTIRQGEAMGSPSSILVRLPATTEHRQISWLRGDAHDMESDDGKR